LLRNSIGNVLLPKMSRNHASGDIGRALELNNRGNLSICFVIYPAVVFIWIFAAPLIDLLYTSSYLDAVPVLRVYALSMLVMSVELATVLLIYEQGRFVMLVSVGVLVGASVLSYVGALQFGLPGAAIGGLIGTLITRWLNFGRAAKMLGVRLSKLQDWRTLRRMLLAAVLAGVFARYTTNHFFGLEYPLAILASGLGLLGLAYVGLVFLFQFTWVPRSMLGLQQWPSSGNGLV
jgi:peptidoglycan biosynthesis protein MviN/MurJ (putative lipid II flippase)